MEKVKGFSLLENLIALTILSFGLLSFLRAEYYALAYCTHALNYSVAIMQLRNYFENKSLDKKDSMAWQRDIKEVLPQGQGDLDGKIYWSPCKEIKHACENYAALSINL